MRKLLIILRDRIDMQRNYMDFWDYIRSIDPRYSHCIDYVILVHTDKSVTDVTRGIRELDHLFQFLVIDVTDSEADGWLAKSWWTKWRKDTEIT